MMNCGCRRRSFRVLERVVLLPVLDLLSPGVVGAASLSSPHHVVQHGFHVPDNRHVDALVLADLGRVDIDMDDLRIRGEGIDLAGDPVDQTGPRWLSAGHIR